MGARPEGSGQELGDDPGPGLSVLIGVNQIGLIQLGEQALQILQSHQDPSLLTHHQELDVPEGILPVQKGHELVECPGDERSFAGKAQVVVYEHVGLVLVPYGDEVQVSSGARGWIGHFMILMT
jgi:hypothetical protein